MSNILVITGCAGFIGINFLQYLVSQDHKYDRVLSLDMHGYATFYNEKYYLNLCQKNNVDILKTDINMLRSLDIKTELWYDSSNTYDVVNFASESHVDNSINKPFELFTNNALLTSSLVQYFGIENINTFVHISTDEVYGELTGKPPYDSWFSENHQYNPNNPYSASKLAQDAFLMSMQHTFNMNVKFVRMANQFGPWQHPEKMMPASILRALSGKSIKIYGSGENIRQWTPVVDTVKCIYDHLMDPISTDSNVLHIAHKNNMILMDNNEVVDVWRKILKNAFHIDTTVEYIDDRKGHDLTYALQTTSNVDEYFKTTLIERFSETIKFYFDNRESFLV